MSRSKHALVLYCLLMYQPFIASINTSVKLISIKLYQIVCNETVNIFDINVVFRIRNGQLNSSMYVYNQISLAF